MKQSPRKNTCLVKVTHRTATGHVKAPHHRALYCQWPLTGNYELLLTSKRSLKKLSDFLRTKCKMKTRHSPGLWRQVVTTVFWLNGPWKTQKTKGITNSELNITQPPNQVSKQDRVTPLTAAAGRLSAGRAWLPTEPSCWPEMPKP